MEENTKIQSDIAFRRLTPGGSSLQKGKHFGLIVKIGLLILVVFAILGIVKTVKIPPKLKEAIVLATTRIPETFTELYFEDHINLPKTIEKGKEYQYKFTIHNLENKDMDYPYTVSLQRDDKKTVIDSGSVFLKNNEYKTIEMSVGPLKKVRLKVVIELVNKNQFISFWMDPPLAR